MKIRHVWVALIAAALVAGLASCGGGGSGGSTPAPTYTVGGTISGSAGVTLRINGAGDYPVAALGAFTIPTGLTNGTVYAVTVTGNAQPCSVTNGTGTMGSTNINNVVVTCTTVVRSASLSAGQEVPSNASTATGRGAVVVNPTTLEITGGITFSGLTGNPTGAHIHVGAAGVNTPAPAIALTIAGNNSSATFPPNSTLSPAQYTALLAGEIYFNVHTAANGGGEIRGQITGTTGVTAGLATLNGAQEVPANASTAIGRGTVVVDSATGAVLIAYATYNVTGASASHIHVGAFGAAPPANVRLALTSVAATVASAAQGVSLSTPQDLTDLIAGNLYFNVHTPTFPGGEIRGQIAVQ